MPWLGTAAEGLRCERRGTHNVESCNTEEASGVKKPAFFKASAATGTVELTGLVTT